MTVEITIESEAFTEEEADKLWEAKHISKLSWHDFFLACANQIIKANKVTKEGKD